MTCEFDSPRVEVRAINGRPLLFIIECLRQQYRYLATINEVASILQAIPPDDMEGLELFAFHQPSPGEEAGCCWSAYSRQFSFEGKPKRAIVLYAIDGREQHITVKQADRAAAEEAECLREDGHRVVLLGNRYIIASSQDAIRMSQLYRGIYHQLYYHKQAAVGIRQECVDVRLANGYARQMKDRWIAETMRYD